MAVRYSVNIIKDVPVALGNESMETQFPPIPAKVSHVLQIFFAEHVVSTCSQMPSPDSSEQAKYGLQVS
jgi:hypothetical protein